MKTIQMLLLLSGIMFIASCAVKVKTVSDQRASFDQYEKFCWFTGCEFTIDGPDYIKKDSATVESFKQAITDELKRKGYVYDENNPDFLLYMQILVKEEETMISTPYDEDNWVLEAFDQLEGQPYVYLKGSMIIDIADAEESAMVWRSNAVRYMDLNPDMTEGNIKKGVKQALRKFPNKSTR